MTTGAEDWLPTDDQLWAFLNEEGLALIPVHYGAARAWVCCANNPEDIQEADVEGDPRNAALAAFIRRRVQAAP